MLAAVQCECEHTRHQNCPAYNLKLNRCNALIHWRKLNWNTEPCTSSYFFPSSGLIRTEVEEQLNLKNKRSYIRLNRNTILWSEERILWPAVIFSFCQVAVCYKRSVCVCMRMAVCVWVTSTSGSVCQSSMKNGTSLIVFWRLVKLWNKVPSLSRNRWPFHYDL